MNGLGHPSVEDVLVDVFEEQCPRLRGFFAHGARGEVFADDLVQETVLRAWGHRRALGAGAPAAPGLRDGARRYLWRVARNLMIDEIRWRQRQRAREGAVPAFAQSEPGAASLEVACGRGPEEAVELEDCLRVVREAVDDLANDRVRECLELWLLGANLESIARERGLSAGQVRGLLQRGRSEIVRRVSERLGE